MHGHALFTAFALLAFAPPTTPTASPPRKADAVGIAVPTDTEDRVPVQIKIVGGSAKASALFEITPVTAYEKQTGDFDCEFTGVPGPYTVTAIYGEVDANGKLTLRKLRASTKINGAAPPPIPPGPIPPGPIPPGPTPPPIPTAGMIDLPGFHVLIKFDRDKFLPNLSSDEIRILNSESDQSVRVYLKKSCPVATDGGMGWRMYPVPAPGVAGPWKAPYERDQGKLPTMTVSKNGKGWEGSIAGWTPEQVIAKCKEVEALP